MTREEFWRSGAGGRSFEGRGTSDYNHKASVREALSRGRPVPRKVLAGYPDLARRNPAGGLPPRIESVADIQLYDGWFERQIGRLYSTHAPLIEIQRLQRDYEIARENEIGRLGSSGKEPWQMTRSEWLRQPGVQDAMEDARRRTSKGLVEAGKVTTDFMRIHRLKVERAFAEGKPVPGRVLSEYGIGKQSVRRNPKEPWEMVPYEFRREMASHPERYAKYTEGIDPRGMALLQGGWSMDVHRKIVAEALGAGWKIPRAVMQSYPELGSGKQGLSNSRKFLKARIHDWKRRTGMPRANPDGIRRSGSSKFGSVIDELFWQLSLDGGPDEELGESESFGWYGKMAISPSIIADLDRTAGDAGVEPLNEAEKEYISNHAGAIISEDSQGFVDAVFFKTNREFEGEWRALEKEYEKFSGEGEGETR